MKTEPVSFRPSASLDARLDALRARTGLPKSRLVELLTDEAERARRYPGIAFRGPDQRRAAWLIGTPFDVWEVVQAWQDLHEDVSAAENRLELTHRQLQLALAYHREFADEIDTALGLARRGLNELEQAYPFIEVVSVPSQ
ncbi:MAG TPA: hypothetical protein VF155_10770 [Candidatus Dormibacteraeota bacterium]